ncbi:MAG: 1-deoxy-D-xylulose-5-phosphate synthase, partial [Sedimenticola sp.]|nr:1-deoxy-D-xylulose-5-phosphate synthase [Sedimenticola sp.]
PADENECRKLLQTAYQHEGPALVRYPRGSGCGAAVADDLAMLPIGKGEIRRQGQQIAILAFGSLLDSALEVADRVDATVANMRFVKPLDEALIQQLANTHNLLVTLEENVIQGGAGSAVNEYLAAIQHSARAINLGLPDHFIEHATPAQQMKEAGLDVESILQVINQAVKQQSGLAAG